MTLKELEQEIERKERFIIMMQKNNKSGFSDDRICELIQELEEIEEEYERKCDERDRYTEIHG